MQRNHSGSLCEACKDRYTHADKILRVGSKPSGEKRVIHDTRKCRALWARIASAAMARWPKTERTQLMATHVQLVDPVPKKRFKRPNAPDTLELWIARRLRADDQDWRLSGVLQREAERCFAGYMNHNNVPMTASSFAHIRERSARLATALAEDMAITYQEHKKRIAYGPPDSFTGELLERPMAQEPSLGTTNGKPEIPHATPATISLRLPDDLPLEGRLAYVDALSGALKVLAIQNQMDQVRAVGDMVFSQIAHWSG